MASIDAAAIDQLIDDLEAESTRRDTPGACSLFSNICGAHTPGCVDTDISVSDLVDDEEYDSLRAFMNSTTNYIPTIPAVGEASYTPVTNWNSTSTSRYSDVHGDDNHNMAAVAKPALPEALDAGDIITTTRRNAYQAWVTTAAGQCLCNCDYCTCNCNYCTCNCNYCTCYCNACSCNNQNSCPSNCTCNCNYACTCNCNQCNCDNHCTCNANCFCDADSCGCNAEK